METLKKINADELTALDGLFIDAEQIWQNDTYLVGLWRCRETFDGRKVIRLSIKRRDKKPLTSWSDKQDIKNQVVGKEHEAIELYPAESRRVDQSHQYHLWVIDDPEYRFSFGWNTRATRVLDDEKGEMVE